MIYLLALILHLFGTHTERSYGQDFKDEWTAGVPEGSFRCIICKQIFPRKASHG